MFRYFSKLTMVLLLATLSFAQEKPAAKPAPKTATHAAPAADKSVNMPSEETVTSFLHQMFGYDSTLSSKVVEIKPSEAEGLTEVDVLVTGPQGSTPNRLYVTADGKHAITGEIIPFGAHPFAAANAELEKKATGPSMGAATAPVMLVEFSDLQCPHCKDAQPNIDKLMSEVKNARLVFQNYPLPMHDWAEKAAEYADCIAHTNNDAFWKFIHSVYEAQKDITAATAEDKFKELADAAGVKSADIAVCAAKPETTGRVQASIDLGRSLDVTGTPTLFVNGRRLGNVGGLPEDVLKSLVEFAAKEGK